MKHMEESWMVQLFHNEFEKSSNLTSPLRVQICHGTVLLLKVCINSLGKYHHSIIVKTHQLLFLACVTPAGAVSERENELATHEVFR